MNVIIPVSYNGKSGTVEIILMPNGVRSIVFNIDGKIMEMIQNGDLQTSYPLIGTVQGKLYKVMDERRVGKKGWRIRDFVLNIETPRGLQKRLMQASGDAVDEICKVGMGSAMICETSFLGKEFNRQESGSEVYVYRNLDEVSKFYSI